MSDQDMEVMRTAAFVDVMQDLRARVSALEQALRLHLAVAPDDPLLLTPVEQQLVKVMQELVKERDRSEALGEACANGTSQIEQLQATLARVEGERDRYKHLALINDACEKEVTRESSKEDLYKHCLFLMKRLAQAAQREARLRAALELIATTNHGNYPDNATPYESGIADGHRCAAKWAQQALSQLSTGSSPPTGSDQHNPAS